MPTEARWRPCSTRSAAPRWCGCSGWRPPGSRCSPRSSGTARPGSVKDRIYAAMLAKAEERGDLKPGMTIIECTTGNAGIACSAVAAIKGYRCTIVMPEGMSNERKTMIRAYGADLVLTPGAGTDIDLALARMREIVAADPDRYFFPGEFENPDNPEAQLASGEEIWEQAGGARRRGRRGAGHRRLDQRGRARAQGPQPVAARVRGRAGGMPADQRAHVGHAWGAGHRRRHRAAEPRPRRDGRHRHRLDRGSARDRASARPGGGAALRALERHQRRRGAQGDRAPSGAASGSSP